MKKYYSDAILHYYGALRKKIPYLLPRPIGFFFYITGKCNLNCSYCWQREDEGRKDGWINSTDREMTPEEWVRVVRKLPRLSFLGLSGGEASLSQSFIPILKASQKRGLPVTVNTNGLALRDKPLEAMLKYGVKNISVSIDGFAGKHDAGRNMPGLFDAIIEGIERLNAVRDSKNVSLTIKSVLLNDTLGELKEFHRFCTEELKADTLNISFAKEGNHAQFSLKYTEDIEQLLSEKSACLYDYEDHDRVIKTLTDVLSDSSGCDVTLYPCMTKPSQIRSFLKMNGTGVYRPCTLPWALNVALPDGQVIPCLSLGLGSLRDNNYDFRRIIAQSKSPFLHTIDAMGESLPKTCNICCFSKIRK